MKELDPSYSTFEDGCQLIERRGGVPEYFGADRSKGLRPTLTVAVDGDWITREGITEIREMLESAGISTLFLPVEKTGGEIRVGSYTYVGVEGIRKFVDSTFNPHDSQQDRGGVYYGSLHSPADK